MAPRYAISPQALAEAVDEHQEELRGRRRVLCERKGALRLNLESDFARTTSNPTAGRSMIVMREQLNVT